MRCYNRNIIMKKLKIIAVFFIFPFVSLWAKGTTDQDLEYVQELETTCENLFYRIETGDLTPEESEMELAELRKRFSLPYTDSDGIIESIIVEIAESSLSANQAMFEFKLLQDSKLMTYRLEQKNSPTEEEPTENPTGSSSQNQSSDKSKDSSGNRDNPHKGG